MNLRSILGFTIAGTVAAACASFGTEPAATSTADAGVTDAGAPDVATATPDAAVDFCAGHTDATFCADFDESENPTAGWDKTLRADGGALDLDGANPKSAPNALHARTSGGTSFDRSALEKDLSLGGTLTIDLDVRYIGVPTSGSYVSPFIVTDAGNHTLYFDGNDQKCYFAGDSFPPLPQLPVSADGPALALDVWHHITVKITADPTNATFDASYDGQALWTNGDPSFPWSVGTALHLSFGVADLYQASDAELEIDNVVLANTR